jgi:5-methylcytosine-specific restriction endonuclease McrA
MKKCSKCNNEFDHIIPLSEAISVDDIVKLNHYTNLQPLCSKVNRDIKKNNIEYGFI